MKQVLQSRSGSTVVRDVPSPPCPVGGVLVRNAFSVISSGTERSRVALSQKSLLAKARERPELVKQVVERARREGIRSTRAAVSRQLSIETPVGYSSAGHVIEIGSRVAGLEPGDAVACCGGGHANHAEIVAMPRNLVARVPEGVPLKQAAFATVGAIALHGIRLGEVTVGERVAVVGCGLIGQLVCRLLRAAGSYVVALDVDAGRVKAAVRGGADHGVPVGPEAGKEVFALTNAVGADSVIVTAASDTNAPLLLAAELVRDRGRLVLVGAVPIEFPRAPLYDKEFSFRVSRSYGPGRYDPEYEERGLDYPIGYVRWTEQRNMECVLDLVARGRLELADLVDEIVPVDEAKHAYERLVGQPEQRPRGAIILSYPNSGLERVERDVSGARASTPTPADEVAVGLVGPGGFASRVLIPALVGAGARLELVGGGSGPSADAAGRGLGFARVAASEESLLSDEAVNAVVVATRHGTHAELAAAALDAGKSVFCEKPLALSYDELDKVARAARAAQGILAVGFNRRFAPLMVESRAFLAAAEPGPVTASYRVSAGHIDRGNWVHDLEEGGGRIFGEVCHFVDALRYIVGRPVVDVYAASHAASGTPIQAHDNVLVTLRYDDGSIATILYTAVGAPGVAKERLEAFKGDRTAILDDFRELQLHRSDDTTRRKVSSQDKGHRAEAAAFVAGVRRGTYPVPLAEIEEVTVATLGIVESLKTGTRVPVRV